MMPYDAYDAKPSIYTIEQFEHNGDFLPVLTSTYCSVRIPGMADIGIFLLTILSTRMFAGVNKIVSIDSPVFADTSV
jgi:hypothetical protein